MKEWIRTSKRPGIPSQIHPLQPHEENSGGDSPINRSALTCPCEGRCPRCMPVQAKLQVGDIDHPLEKEADHQAHAAMQGQSLPRLPVSMAHFHPQDTVQELGMTGSGAPLPEAVQQEWTHRLGQDCSHVRVHTNTQAREMTQTLKARALTYGNHILFNQGEFSPHTEAGKRLLGHELVHVGQQARSLGTPAIQCQPQPKTPPPDPFELSELMKEYTKQNANGWCKLPLGKPDTYFFPNTKPKAPDRRAMIVAGIHGNETSAAKLGEEACKQLQATPTLSDFNLVFIPKASDSQRREVKLGNTWIDPNREFGTNYRSQHAVPGRITDAINGFKPERILSIHTISDDKLAGIFLDPIHSNKSFPQTKKYLDWQKKLAKAGFSPERILDKLSYPELETDKQRESAFTGDPQNTDAMNLTKEMIIAMEPTPSTPVNEFTPGNVAGKKQITVGGKSKTMDFPASLMPAATPPNTQPFNLLYPQQAQIQSEGVSLGEWLSGQGKTIITIEVPPWENDKVYNQDTSKTKFTKTHMAKFLLAIWKFLKG